MAPRPGPLLLEPAPVAELGDLVALVVLFLAVAGGGAFAFVTGVSLDAFSTGDALAYASGMVAIEAVLGADSPAHPVLYGVLLGGFVTATALTRVGGRGDGGSAGGG